MMTALNQRFSDVFRFLIMPEDSTGSFDRDLPFFENKNFNMFINIIKTVLWGGVAFGVAALLAGL